jgi:hypothetical protein
MKTSLAILVSLIVLAPSFAHAGKYTNGGKGKRTACSSYTYITGTTKTMCRQRANSLSVGRSPCSWFGDLAH